MTFGTGSAAQVLAQFLTHRHGFCFTIAPLHVGQDAFPRMTALCVTTSGVDVTEFNFLRAAIHQNLPDIGRQLSVFSIDGELEMFCE